MAAAPTRVREETATEPAAPVKIGVVDWTAPDGEAAPALEASVAGEVAIKVPFW